MSKEFRRGPEQKQKTVSRGIIFERKQKMLPEEIEQKLLLYSLMSYQRRNKPWDTHEVDLFKKELALALAEKFPSEIAATLGCSATKVRKDLKKIETILDIQIPKAKPERKRRRPKSKPKNPGRTEEQISSEREKAIALRKEGLSYSEIAKQLNCSKATVIARLKHVAEVKDIVVKPKRVEKIDPEKEALMQRVYDYKKRTRFSNNRVGLRFGIAEKTVRNYILAVEEKQSGV